MENPQNGNKICVIHHTEKPPVCKDENPPSQNLKTNGSSTNETPNSNSEFDLLLEGSNDKNPLQSYSSSLFRSNHELSDYSVDNFQSNPSDFNTSPIQESDSKTSSDSSITKNKSNENIGVKRPSYQSELAGEKIGSYLLKGWTLLDRVCQNENCIGVPLVRNSEMLEKCALCDTNYITEENLMKKLKTQPGSMSTIDDPANNFDITVDPVTNKIKFGDRENIDASLPASDLNRGSIFENTNISIQNINSKKPTSGQSSSTRDLNNISNGLNLPSNINTNTDLSVKKQLDIFNLPHLATSNNLLNGETHLVGPALELARLSAAQSNIENKKQLTQLNKLAKEVLFQKMRELLANLKDAKNLGLISELLTVIDKCAKTIDSCSKI
ncbi:hypothetical protein AYI68_g1753 [Smittium mucronatum]|uniref:Uncharacterized protein n=1 Tax=Smittium mucronatum TaxID=133383 RepID=A0A1R0H4R0_9FUNG|nr:hypothetical protein AYI68_g1753 [Smittium mucronatum]